jgi:hypothetical protein
MQFLISAKTPENPPYCHVPVSGEYFTDSGVFGGVPAGVGFRCA